MEAMTVMNPEAPIRFEEDLPVWISASCVRAIALHCNPNAVTVVYVLRGTADVKVSFESFRLGAGEFVVVNHSDFYSVRSDDAENIVILIHISVSHYEKSIGFLRFIVFACDSVTTIDDRQEQLDHIRRLIAGLLDILSRHDRALYADAEHTAHEILNILSVHFSILRHRAGDTTFSRQKMDKYLTIMKKLDEDYQKKTLLDDISKSEYYSRFYLAHLYKGMMLMSIQDSLSATRCFKSERLLLTTKKSIQTISTECGFSDTKYYYKHFKLWYLCTPKQYRKLFQPEVFIKNEMREIALDEAATIMSALLNAGRPKPEGSEKPNAACGVKAIFQGPVELNIVYHDPMDRESAERLRGELEAMFQHARVDSSLAQD